MRRNYGNCWVEYRDPLDLMDHPLKMGDWLILVSKGQ